MGSFEVSNMFRRKKSPLWRPAAALAALALLMSGCDSSGVGKTFPVAGKITVNGEALTTGTGYVLFRPDKTKGNDSPFEANGNVDKDGNYRLSTKTKGGAPPGWYQIEVFVSLPPAGVPQGKRTAANAAPISLIDTKYNSVETSGLAVEVVDNPSPGAYDLALTKSAQATGRR
jgi:hypothetical protein